MIILSSILLILGAIFCLLASIGILRMPDLYCRLHAATKAGSFGAGIILLSLCFASGELRVVLQSILILFFFFLTAPIAAYALSKVALQKKVKVWKPESLANFRIVKSYSEP